MKILLVDDHKIVRDGLRALIEKQDDMDLVAEAENGRDAVRLASEFHPDMVIMDIAMPEMNGIEASRQILLENPETKIIVLSMHSDRRFVMEALKAGVSGYLLKDDAFEEMVYAIRAVMNRKMYLSPSIAGTVVADFISGSALHESKIFPQLSPREKEVLQLLSEGKTTREIAATLTVSIKTIETHRQRIMSKLDVHSVAELTKFAIREGLTSVDQ